MILLVALASMASGQQFEAAYVTSPDVPAPENFGKAVAVHGDWAIATGPTRNRAHVFHRTPQGNFLV